MQRAYMRCTVGPLDPVHQCSNKAGRQARSILVQGQCTEASQEKLESLDSTEDHPPVELELRNVTTAHDLI